MGKYEDCSKSSWNFLKTSKGNFWNLCNLTVSICNMFSITGLDDVYTYMLNLSPLWYRWASMYIDVTSFLHIRWTSHILCIITTNVSAFCVSRDPYLECSLIPVLTEGLDYVPGCLPYLRCAVESLSSQTRLNLSKKCENPLE